MFMGGAEHRGLVAVLRSVGLCDVHRATNLLARVCTCCKCDAGYSVSSPNSLPLSRSVDKEVPEDEVEPRRWN